MVFTPAEMQDCQAKLNSLCTFLRDIPNHRMNWMPQWEPKLRLFLSEIHRRYGITLTMDPAETQRFLLHVYKLHQRYRIGTYESNYHKREINRTYPLSVQLILMVFEDCFGFPPPETEVAYLAMYIAMKLRRHSKRIDCVIVTAKNPSVAWPMKQWMEDHFTRHLQSVEIVEHYRFSPTMAREDLLILTTGEDVVLSCPQAILVKPFRLENEYDLIDQCIQRIRNGYRQSIFDTFAARYYRGIEPLETRGKNLYEVLDTMGISMSPGKQYEFVLDTDGFLLPRIHMGMGENTIRAFSLTTPVVHRGTELHYLILSDYYTDTGEMLDFYDCLRTLLIPGRLDSLRCGK